MEFGDHQHHHLQQNQELRHHVCKFCSKSFGCGRSLGGHMRSHMINDTSAQTDGSKITRKKLPPLSTYLMSNPNHNPTTKKKKKKKRSNRRMTRYTRPANFSSISLANNASSSTSEVEQEQGEVALCLILLSRDVGQWGGSNSLASGSSDNKSVSTRSTEMKNSPCEVKLKSLGELRLEEDDGLKLGDRKTEFIASDEAKKCEQEDQSGIKDIGIEEAGEVVPDSCNHLIKRKSIDPFDLEMKPDNSKKFKALDGEDGSIKFECTTCNKVFHSYQALGGHRASHKKTKGCFASKIDSSENSIETESSPDRTSDSKRLTNHSITTNEVQANQMLVTDCEDRAETSYVTRKSKGHECPICLKVFPSGQALGGHKRAHLVVPPNYLHHQAKTVPIPVAAAPAEPMILDLNLPAPVEEESNGLVGFNSWWLGSSHNCEPLLGLISN